MICFDTAPLIWGIQGKAKEGQEHLVEQTKRYIKHLSEKRKKVAIPAPVVAEYLQKFNEYERQKQIVVLQKYFRIPSFDAKAAILAAELEGNKEVISEIKKAGNITRDQIRIDAQVVSTAIVCGADKIISHDPHLKKISQGRIDIIEVPNIHSQMEFDFQDHAQNTTT